MVRTSVAESLLASVKRPPRPPKLFRQCQTFFTAPRETNEKNVSLPSLPLEDLLRFTFLVQKIRLDSCIRQQGTTSVSEGADLLQKIKVVAVLS